MKEFRFDCPSCGQHILVQEQWSGRQITCPSCKTQITIPSPVKAVKPKKATVPLPRPASPAAPSSIPTASPAKPATQKLNGRLPAIEATAGSDAGSHVSLVAAQPQPMRVAVLAPEVKLDMVRAVRRRIGDEANWLPGIVNGKSAYAARLEGGAVVPVEVEDPQAQRFSLMGAFLLELRGRNVAGSAPGRRRLLDEEIPDAIREILFREMSEEEREDRPDPLADVNPLSISHAQCLAALDVLEQRYLERMRQLEAEKAQRKLGNVRLTDLVRKLENKAKVAPEDVATALYHEIVEVRRRLERLEGRMADPKKTTQLLRRNQGSKH